MSVVFISGVVNEMKQIDTEILRITNIRKSLLAKKKELEKSLKKYLKDNNEEGIWYGDVLVTLDEKDTRKRRKKTERDENARNVLQKHGISNASKVLEELNEAMKGEQYVQEVIKIKNYKQKK